MTGRPRRTSPGAGDAGPTFWARREADGSYVVGFTEDAQKAPGKVVFFRGPVQGRVYSGAAPAMTLESEKCVRQIPLPGPATVVDVNSLLEGDPGAINRDPYGNGWVCRLRAPHGEYLEAATERSPRRAR